MQLFSDSTFYAYLIVLSIPAIILGIREKPIRHYGFLVSALFIWLAMGHNLRAMAYMIGFCLYEYLLISQYIKRRQVEGRVTRSYYIALVLSLLPLSLNKVFLLWENPYHIFGFMGISYMTFKAVQMVIEIYDGLIKEIKLYDFCYLLLFFPVVLSGPIDRSRRFDSDLYRIIPRDEYLEMVGLGILKILQGMVYKSILAVCFFAIMTQFGTGSGLRPLLIYMYTYGFYLFFDFAGYSLMAVGASYIFGIVTPENFKAPFISKDIKDFWNRWHITLSHWFRDYLFSRITMNIIRSGKTRNKLLIASIAFMINMGVMGIWHGLAPNYIVYGLYHGLLLTLCEIYQKKWKFYKKHKKDTWFTLVQWFVTFNLVMFGFLIFSGRLF